MNYYCKTISAGLAKKLKEKGMHPLKDSRMEGWLNSGDNITYAEVFDWLMSEKGINIRIESDWDIETQIVTELACDFYIEKVGMRPIYVDIQNWHESAEAAIERALELINGD